jgi:hypothetical protein
MIAYNVGLIIEAMVRFAMTQYSILRTKDSQGVSLRAGLYAHTAQALATGRYPLLSLTEVCLNKWLKSLIQI